MKLYNQITNCYSLLNIIDNNISQGTPNKQLNDYVSPCGTKGCILGDYALANGYEAWVKQHSLFPLTKRQTIQQMNSNTITSFINTKKEFGIKPSLLYEKLFGAALHGGWKTRRKRLLYHIRKLEIKYTEKTNKTYTRPIDSKEPIPRIDWNKLSIELLENNDLSLKSV